MKKLSKAQLRLLCDLASHEAACSGSTEIHKREVRTARALNKAGFLMFDVARDHFGDLYVSESEALLTTAGWRIAYTELARKMAKLHPGEYELVGH